MSAEHETWLKMVQGHPMGGTAYLSMTSSEDEPFLSGVNFTAMPPSKRWRQMEALSGGEKVASQDIDLGGCLSS